MRLVFDLILCWLAGANGEEYEVHAASFVGLEGTAEPYCRRALLPPSPGKENGQAVEVVRREKERRTRN